MIPLRCASMPNQVIHRMSATRDQSKPGGFLGCPLSMVALIPALIGDLFP
jgi:hypothetical protein